jgi:hypothetical protein
MDHGGVSAIVPMPSGAASLLGTAALFFSVNGGADFGTVNFAHRMRIGGLVAEPGEKSTVAALFGLELANQTAWAIIRFNFTSSLERPCSLADDYEVCATRRGKYKS